MEEHPVDQLFLNQAGRQLVQPVAPHLAHFDDVGRTSGERSRAGRDQQQPLYGRTSARRIEQVLPRLGRH